MLGSNGLDFIHKHFASFQSRGKGQEQSDLRNLIEKYREWAFIMYPAMRFEDIVKKTQKFSSSNIVKNHLQKLRDKRDGVQVMEIGIDEDEEDIDLVMNDRQNENNSNEAENAQRQLERIPDDTKTSDFDAVVAERGGNRQNRTNNVQKQNNIQNNGNFWGPDPLADMMDNGCEPGEDEAALAAMMYN